MRNYIVEDYEKLNRREAQKSNLRSPVSLVGVNSVVHPYPNNGIHLKERVDFNGATLANGVSPTPTHIRVPETDPETPYPFFCIS